MKIDGVLDDRDIEPLLLRVAPGLVVDLVPSEDAAYRASKAKRQQSRPVASAMSEMNVEAVTVVAGDFTRTHPPHSSVAFSGLSLGRRASSLFHWILFVSQTRVFGALGSAVWGLIACLAQAFLVFPLCLHWYFLLNTRAALRGNI